MKKPPDSLTEFRALVQSMRDLGVTEAVLPGGMSAKLGAVPQVAKEPPKRKRCECGHPLSQHNDKGICMQRLVNRAPCTGHCRIIEAGE